MSRTLSDIFELFEGFYQSPELHVQSRDRIKRN